MHILTADIIESDDDFAPPAAGAAPPAAGAVGGADGRGGGVGGSGVQVQMGGAKGMAGWMTTKEVLVQGVFSHNRR